MPHTKIARRIEFRFLRCKRRVSLSDVGLRTLMQFGTYLRSDLTIGGYASNAFEVGPKLFDRLMTFFGFGGGRTYKHTLEFVGPFLVSRRQRQISDLLIRVKSRRFARKQRIDRFPQ